MPGSHSYEAMDSLDATLFGVLLLGTAFATAALLARFIPFYRRELEHIKNRQLALDGMRGAAAVIVATHHGTMFFQYFLTGQWGQAGSRLVQFFGPAGVLIFFMLTGFLFWSKARLGLGRIKAWSLWRGRVFRIAPLYLLSVVFLLAAALWDGGKAGAALKDPKAALRLLGLGATNWPKTYNFGQYNAYVVWTLYYEWRFYLFLPLLAWFAVGRRTIWLGMALYLLVATLFWFGPDYQLYLVFILGMSCPLLLEDSNLRKSLCRPVVAAAALAVTVILSIVNYSEVPSFAVAGSLFPLFLAAAAGNNFFGFLTSRPMRCLGMISYSLYLLHGVVFFVIIRELKHIGTIPPMWALCLTLMAGIAIITLLSALTFRWIEFPFFARKPVPLPSLPVKPVAGSMA